jgi:AmiR/NasT family two-component response regulator
VVTGRARAENAKYCLVAEQGRGVADKEMFNKIRETMMQRAIDIIQNELKPEEITQKIRHFQKMAKVGT